jgi:hypothetical protein
MDSNHDKELQRLLCYHYTTGQGGNKVALPTGTGNGKSVVRNVSRVAGVEEAGRHLSEKISQI